VDYIALHGGHGQEDADEDYECRKRGEEDEEYEPGAEEEIQEGGLEQSLLAACKEAMGMKEMAKIKRLYDQILKDELEHTPKYKRITQAMHQVLAIHNSAGPST